MGEAFYDRYLDKTGAEAVGYDVISILTLYFFDALLEFGKADPDSGQLSFDDIATISKFRLTHLGAKWNENIEK
ncbi:hypothetical protein [Pantoea sp. MQR6]|uniref:hypothetical protein n=1 Tax=Pantoea sp. MQR6 TaxID=2907307 RepID=UPI001FAAF074|nr:hypothetical protein [Pantoea sp. MQR6]